MKPIKTLTTTPMKNLLVLVLIFSIHSLYAQENQTANTANQKELTEVEKLVNDLDGKNFTVLANRMCTTFITSKTLKGSDVKKEVNISISKFLGLNPDNDNTKEIISFWNTYSEKLICTIEDSRGRTPEHALKRAISTHTHSEMFFKYLMSYGPGVIDFNAVEIVDGEKETIIDYLDKIIASPDFEKNYNTSDVKRLRGSLVEYFNAKKASELEN